MKLRSTATAVLALAALALGCKPAVRGRCNSTHDCRQGAYCAVDGICLASSGTCAPACGEGEICSGSICAALKPVVSVKAPSGPLSPALPHVTVQVEAAVGIALHGIAVEVDNSLEAVASGTLDAPQAGDNLVTLSNFKFNAVGNVSVRATLRFQVAGAAEESVSSVAVPATVDAMPPTVTVFVPPTVESTKANGWFSRTGGPLDVRATVDDGAGSGAQSATLSFDTCPASAPCVYGGTAISQGGGATVFSFTVERAVQAAGSEAPLAVTVKAQDAAGNQAQGTGAVQIDDAPPQIGGLGLVSTGVTGEDGKTWFVGGNTAPAVEIVIPVVDAGAGFASLALHLDPQDLPSAFPPASLDLTGTPAADGVHFRLPVASIQGKEEHFRFTLTATDLLQHVATLGPDNPNSMIWVDAAPPVILNGPHVVYASATPSGVCGPADSGSFKCGRQNATHLLPDDSVTVTYDAYDCGAGMGAAQDSTASTLAGGSRIIATTDKSRNGTPCSSVNGSNNKTHHYSFTFSVAAQAPVLDPPIDLVGTSLVKLAANAADRLQQASVSAPNTGTSGDGLALISLWRWRNQVAGAFAQPSGAPALLPGTAGARQIAVGTMLGASSPNFFVVNPDGSTAWSATVMLTPITGDIAVGPTGRVYVVGPPAPNCNSSCTGTLTILLAPTSGVMGTAHACAVTNVSFGSPPAVIAANGAIPERAVLASADNTVAATSNVFLFEENNGCQADPPALLPVGASNKSSGLSANGTSVFLSTGQGFTSFDAFDPTTARAYTSTATVSTASPPALSAGSLRAWFGSGGSDKMVHSALQSTCTGGTKCWVDDSAFPAASATSPFPFTPVFDAAAVFAVDASAVVHAFPRTTNGSAWSQDFVNPNPPLPSGWPTPGSATVSPPVLLQQETLLEVRNDGVVALATSAGIAPLIKAAPTGLPVAPVVDARAGGSVAYVVDGEGWLTAVQLPLAPLAAGQNAWPRPGRDSCNSRNAASTCQ